MGFLLRSYFVLRIIQACWSYVLLDQAIPGLVLSQYDLIFAGGGTAACIMAGRLAVASPALKILVLEAGPSTFEKLEHIQPARYLTHLAPFSTTEQFYTSPPSNVVAGRSITVPSGKVLGGGGSVNFMLYNRPAASDFDDWNVTGWGSADLIPLLAKAETYEVDPQAATHGSSGPLHVSYGGNFLDISKQFLDIGPQFEKTRPLGPDGNDFSNKSINIFYHMPKWISGNGHRSDIPHHYIFNQASTPNFHVSVGSRVKRVTFTGTKATGIEFIYDKHVFPDVAQTVHTVTASKLVVVSAGAMGSPLILERSGIGSSSVLSKAGINQLVDLPGVGANYQDHLFYVTPYFADPSTTTYDNLFRNSYADWFAGLAQWDADGTGIVAGNGVDAAIKMRPHDDEVAELGDDFTDRWNSFYVNKTDKPLFWLSALAGLPGDQTGLPVTNYLSAGCFMGYPVGRGHLHISGSDIYAAPDFDSGFLNGGASDLAILRWGYKRGRELIRRMPSFRGALAPAHPAFSSSSDAGAKLSESSPVAIDAPKIVYTADDDAAIDANIQAMVGTTWHSLGTCAMKPQANGGVVDGNLNVYGVTNLKVADLSIPPSNVNANTYSTAIAIGEKAATIIAKELGITL